MHASPLSSTPQKSSGKKIISVIIGLIVIAALAVGAYFFFLSGKVAADDLVEQTVQQTTYLRPEEWQAVPLGIGLETYSNAQEGSQSVSAVTVGTSISIRSYGSTPDDAYYDTIRSQTMQRETVDSIQALFRNGGKDCTSEITFNVEPDSKKANQTIGMALATGTCTREDGTYIVKRRTVIGEDGLMRHIMIAATESDWSKNKATFQAILDSVGQVQTAQ